MNLLNDLTLNSVLAALLTISVAGCQEAAPPAKPSGTASPTDGPATPAHDPDDVVITEKDVERPADYNAAVRRIQGYRDQIRDEIAAGRPGKAHRALDELDIVLNWLPEIAQSSRVPRDKWEAVNTAAQAVRELFNKVHANIDTGQYPDYKSHAAAIDSEIEKLAAVTAE
jgi:hypothetical protein